jgi:hypothetical protein
MSQPTTFRNVWFLPGENTWRRWSLFAYEDIGILTVGDGHIEFVGRRRHVSISSIDELKFGTQGRDFINNWVHIESGDQTVYFADGGWWGFRGHLAHGTRKILRAVLASFPTTTAEQAAAPNRSEAPNLSSRSSARGSEG